MIVFISGCAETNISKKDVSSDVPCKESYDRFMQVQSSIHPTTLLEYKQVNTLEELKSFEHDYEQTSRYDDAFSPSQRYGGMSGKASDFKPTYVFAVKEDATSVNEINIVELCICSGTTFSCGNRDS